MHYKHFKAQDGNSRNVGNVRACKALCMPFGRKLERQLPGIANIT